MDTQTATPKAPRKVGPKKVTKVTTKAATAVKTDDGRIALKSICSKLQIEPRAARRKLRNADLGFHDHRDRWSFTEKQAEKVREILKPAN